MPVVSCSRKCRRLWLACKPFSARKSSGGKIDSDPNLKMFHIRIVSTPDVVEPNSPRHSRGEKSDESCDPIGLAPRSRMSPAGRIFRLIQFLVFRSAIEKPRAYRLVLQFLNISLLAYLPEVLGVWSCLELDSFFSRRWGDLRFSGPWCSVKSRRVLRLCRFFQTTRP